MLRLNLLIAIRSLSKKRSYVIINTLGLSIGLASCILIVLFIQDQFSYDHMLIDADRIYRMKELKTSAGIETRSAVVPYSFARTLVQDFPEVENATAFAGPYDQQIGITNQEGQKVYFSEKGVLLADSSFFKVLGFDLLQGNAEKTLEKPNSVVLTKSLATKYFGDIDPLGKTISIGRRSCIVTGVCMDPPYNSHFKFSLLISSTSFAWLSQDQFNLRRAYCYLKLKPNGNPQNLEDKFPQMTSKYVGAEVARIHNTTWEDYLKAGNGYNYSIQPITSIHLDTEVSNGMRSSGNPTTLHVLIGIAVLIFIIACINFMNLTTARSMERAKEVGIRKVLGSVKLQLIFQFLTESLLLTTAAILGAILLTYLVLPVFNTFNETQISLGISFMTVSIACAVIIFVTVLSGMYPAFVLSSFKPSDILKGSFANQPKGKLMKNGMVIFQFWISIVLIIGTIIIYKQVDFMKTKNLGFDQDQLVVIEGIFNMDPNYAKPFLQEIKTNASVHNAVGTLWIQGYQGTWSDEYKRNENAEIVTMSRVILGDGVGEVMDFKLKAGEFFSNKSSDSLSVLINESAVAALDIKDPVGKKLILVNHDNGSIDQEYFIIKGVVADFNYRSLRSSIEPLVMMSSDYFHGRSSYVLAKLSHKADHNTILELENIWNTHFPDKPFNWSFMDRTIEDNYKSEIKLSVIFSVFAFLSIFISTVGLLALLSYAVHSRRKEISIRKVIGATISNIVILLSKDLSKMLVISFVLAIPVSLYAINRWLEGYAYRVSVTFTTFLIAGSAIAIIAFSMLIFQGIKAAKSKPADVLQSD